MLWILALKHREYRTERVIVSKTLDRTGVIDIGLKSAHTVACGVLGTGVMHATSNCCGTVNSLNDK